MPLLHGQSVVVLTLSVLAPQAAALKYLSYYGTNVTAQGSWLNLAITEDGITSDAFYTQYKTPSLLRMPGTNVFSRGTRSKNGTVEKGGGLAAGWEGALESWTKKFVLPRMANKTAIGCHARPLPAMKPIISCSTSSPQTLDH